MPWSLPVHPLLDPAHSTGAYLMTCSLTSPACLNARLGPDCKARVERKRSSGGFRPHATSGGGGVSAVHPFLRKKYRGPAKCARQKKAAVKV